jgi:hypothetical protein
MSLTSHVQNVSVIHLPRLSPYVTEIIVDLEDVDGVVITDTTLFRYLKKIRIKLCITAGILQTSRKPTTYSGVELYGVLYPTLVSREAN